MLQWRHVFAAWQHCRIDRCASAANSANIRTWNGRKAFRQKDQVISSSSRVILFLGGGIFLLPDAVAIFLSPSPKSTFFSDAWRIDFICMQTGGTCHEFAAWQHCADKHCACAAIEAIFIHGQGASRSDEKTR
jgi:hypothetical protein